MALAIYKSGQGYWTRMLTAIGAGILVLAGMGWLWQQLSAMGTNVTPTYSYAEFASGVSTWAKNANHPAAALTSLGSVTIEKDQDHPPTKYILTDKATKQTFELTPTQFAAAINAAQDNVSKQHKIKSDLDVTAEDVLSAEVSDQTLTVGVATFAARNRLYIQSAIELVVLAIFAVGIYYILNKPKVVDFMIATEAEMRKVSWPDRREIVGSTWVVICGTLMMAVLLQLVDVIFFKFFAAIHVLRIKS